MSVTKKDNHQEDIELLLNDSSLEKRGIVHIGAHKGQEVDFYLKIGFQNILLIEANPDLAAELKAKYKDDARIKVEQCAIADTTGELEFHIHTSRSGSTEPASILEMKEFSKIVESLTTVKTIKVPAYTLIDLFDKEEYEVQDYNFMNVDVQGAEIHVFRGCVGIFEKFDGIISEVNLVELYKNTALEEELTNFLKEQSFEKINCVYHELYKEEKYFPAWGECLFLRKDLIS